MSTALDLSQYTRIPHVAILDTFSDSEVDLSREDLERIVANNNGRIADTGDMCPLILGHTDEDAPESQQPPIVGYASDFSLGMIGNVNPRPCIYADFLVPPDKVDLVKRFPRRSVELFLKDGLIDPIALLGATTPLRNLGLMLSKSSEKKRFEFNADEAEKMTPGVTPADVPMTMADLQKVILEVLMSSPIGQLAQKQADQTAASAGDEGKDQASTDTPPAEVPPVEKPVEPVKNDAMHVPCFGGDEQTKKNAESETVAMSKEDDKVRLERDQLAVQFAQLKAEQAATKKIAEESASKLRFAAREGDLKQLMYQGFQFELAGEMEDVATMDDAAYAKHLERIKARYQRNPVGSSPIPASALAAPRNESDRAKVELSEKAKKYALAHGITDFKVALAKVQAGAA